MARGAYHPVIGESLPRKGFGVSRKFSISLLAMVLLFAACGGGGGDATDTTADQDEVTTTAAAPTTTAAPATTATTEDDGGRPSVGMGDIPQECIDVLADYLRAIEPTVEVVDWETADLSTLEEVANTLEATYEEHEEAIEAAGCDEYDVEATDEESFEFLIALAESEAPGTVPYFEMIGELGTGAGEAVSGDCETDIAALQALVTEHGSMENLAVADLTKVGTLAESITSTCTLERATEFFEQADVVAFMGG